MSVLQKSLAIAILSALISRLCCVIPFVAIISGMTGGATMFSFLEPWRPLLVTISVSILAFGFHQAYKKPNNIDKLRPCCKEKAEIKSKRNRRYLWTTTVISVVLFSFPFYSHSFINTTSSQKADTKNIKTIQLSIDGMSCQGCANNIMLTLSRADGILKDTVVFATKTATVTFNESKISSPQVIATIDNIGFTARTKK
jgi:copper chaperone CopZ